MKMEKIDKWLIVGIGILLVLALMKYGGFWFFGQMEEFVAAKSWGYGSSCPVSGQDNWCRSYGGNKVVCRNTYYVSRTLQLECYYNKFKYCKPSDCPPSPYYYGWEGTECTYKVVAETICYKVYESCSKYDKRYCANKQDIYERGVCQSGYGTRDKCLQGYCTTEKYWSNVECCQDADCPTNYKCQNTKCVYVAPPTPKTCEGYGYYTTEQPCPAGTKPVTIKVDSLICYTGKCEAIAPTPPPTPTPPVTPAPKPVPTETYLAIGIFITIIILLVVIFILKKRGRI
jgi:hypothetical protein